jgi:hypothetical protein
MERPLARFKLISDDLIDFISKQSEDNPSVDLDDYSVVVSYVGYMPSAYSMIADKAVDASTGVQFNSSCEQVNDSEVFLGYDYVFANESNTAVTIQVALYDKIGKCVSSSKSVKVNLRRNHCTILRGKFMSSDSSDGIKIETKYDVFHCASIFACMALSTLICWFGLYLSMPIHISLISNVVVGVMFAIITWHIQDIIDLKSKSTRKERLIEKCKQLNYNTIKTEIAVKFFIDKEKPKDVWNWICENRPMAMSWDSLYNLKSKMKKDLF